MIDPVPLIKAAMRDKILYHYVKFGTVIARRATPGARVVTKLDGRVETRNIASDGDWLVTGPKGEQYLISESKFAERYRSTSQPNRFQPVGECWAVEYHGPNVQFMAPWGEPMVLTEGDYLCTTKVGSDDIYRIEREVFHQTYKRKR